MFFVTIAQTKMKKSPQKCKFLQSFTKLGLLTKFSADGVRLPSANYIERGCRVPLSEGTVKNAQNERLQSNGVLFRTPSG